jgi:hypothetical protein
MQTSMFVAVLVALGQLDGADSRYGELDNQPAQTEQTPPAADNWDYAPITPADATAAPAGQPAKVDPATNVVEVKPSDLWKSLSTAPKTDQLVGAEISLAEAVNDAAARAEQTARVSAYWDLAAAVADYYLSLRESTELATLRQSIARPSFAWDEARLAQTTRVQVARATAEAAQYRLQRLLKSSAHAGLLLPSDSPHVGAYDTRYEENFADRDSAEALQLSELLPKLHQDLRNQATSVAIDQQWLQAASQQRDPQSDGAVLLKAYELLSLRRQEFVRSVAKYNIQIVRYSELATPGPVDTNRLVAMLIESPHTVTTPARDAGVTRTSAEEPIDGASRASSPRTFDEPPQVIDRKPALEKGQERSILVQP